MRFACLACAPGLKRAATHEPLGPPPLYRAGRTRLTSAQLSQPAMARRTRCSPLRCWASPQMARLLRRLGPRLPRSCRSTRAREGRSSRTGACSSSKSSARLDRCARRSTASCWRRRTGSPTWCGSPGEWHGGACMLACLHACGRKLRVAANCADGTHCPWHLGARQAASTAASCDVGHTTATR